jgi:hypothetical protein
VSARLLPAPTAEERILARQAAVCLRTALANPSLRGERTVIHVDLRRPRRGEWWETWSRLPGFTRVNGRAYRHALLPGWEYLAAEVRAEMIPDLDHLAETGERPKVATR